MELERELTPDESALIHWMLKNGCSNLDEYVDQLSHATVCRKCACGCPSIDLSIDGKTPDYSIGLSVLADYQWKPSSGGLMGAFVFARKGQLSGLEIYSQDGCEIPSCIPSPSELELVPWEKGNA